MASTGSRCFSHVNGSDSFLADPPRDTGGSAELAGVVGAVSPASGVLVWSEDGILEFANERVFDIAGKTPVNGTSVAQVVDALGLRTPDAQSGYPPERLLASASATKIDDGVIVRPDGTCRYIEGRTTSVCSTEGGPYRFVTVFDDVTETRNEQRLRRCEVSILEMIATDRPLAQTLDFLVREFEALADGMLASLLFVDEHACLRHASAPSLPKDWTRIVDGVPIGPNTGSCGTAAYLKEPVIAVDIAVDPRWADYKDAALSFGLQACWSVPILGRGRCILGTFAFYYLQPREPSANLLDLAGHAAHLASVAIQHDRQQRSLVESEALSRTIVESALDANVQMDEHGRVSGWNSRAEWMFGYSAKEAIGELVSSLIIPERMHDAHDQGLEHYLRHGESALFDRRVEKMALHKDGYEFPVALSVRPVRVGERTLFSAFIQDLSDIRRTEAALRRARETEQWQRVFDLNPCSVGIGREGQLVYVNEYFKSLFGIDVGDDVRSIYVDPDDRRVIMAQLDADRPVVDIELRAYDAGRNMIDLLATFHRLDYDGAPCVVAYLIDVTALKKTEHALKRVSERLQLATRSANIGIWSWDIESNESQWDEVMHALFQLSPQVLRNDPGAWKSRVHPDDLRRVEAELRRALREGSTIEFEYRVVLADGALRHYRANATAESDASGRRSRFVGTNLDVTDARVASDRLRQAKEDAERATQAKSRFLANMSHEIRTPMNAVLGYANLLMRDASLSETHRRKVSVIRSGGTHLLSMIDEILEMSRIEAGESTLSIAPFSMHELVDEIHSLFAESTAGKRIAWRSFVDDSLPDEIIGDGVKIRQVLINLVGNAVKFTETGFVHLRAFASDTPSGRVRVGVAVEDSGPGMKPADLELVFKPFSRLEPESSRGTGLGLSISRSFARLMDGDIDVQSEPGRGSTFTFSFEAARIGARGADSLGNARGNAADERPLELKVAGRRPRVLVVDDVRTNREILVDLLTDAGCDIETASNGQQAISTHGRFHPDLVLMDLRMPVKDGFEATRELRSLGTPACILAISASADDKTERDALAAGADEFVSKPFRDDDLLARIRRRLSAADA